VIAQLAMLPDARAMRRIDVAALFLTVVFAALGFFVGLQLWDLARLSGNLVAAADAIDQTSRGVALLNRVPVVGDAAAQLSGSIATTATSVRETAARSANTIKYLAVLLGLAVGLVPILPMFVGYLPLRTARWRQIRALRRLVHGRPEPEPLLVEQLARQAAARLPLGDLRRVSRSPWRDLADGRHRALAAAELRRLGLAPAPDWLGGPTSERRGEQ